MEEMQNKVKREIKRKEVPLFGKFIITCDKMGYIVGEKTNTQTGYRNASYYTSLSAALRGGLEKAMRLKWAEGEIDSLEEWFRQAKGLKDEIEEMTNRCEFKVFMHEED